MKNRANTDIFLILSVLYMKQKLIKGQKLSDLASVKPEVFIRNISRELVFAHGNKKASILLLFADQNTGYC
jgi:hypothetical protein